MLGCAPWWKNRSYLSLITCPHLIVSITHTRTHTNPLITSLMRPFLSSFQGCTTVSPAPHQEPVSSPLLATSSSAPASSTQCASPAVTRRCVMGHARRNGHNCQPPSPWARRSSLCFLSTSFCPPRCADRPSHTELRCVLEMFCWWQWRQTGAVLTETVANIWMRVFVLPGFLSQKNHPAMGRFLTSRVLRWCSGWTSFGLFCWTAGGSFSSRLYLLTLRGQKFSSIIHFLNNDLFWINAFTWNNHFAAFMNCVTRMTMILLNDSGEKSAVRKKNQMKEC